MPRHSRCHCAASRDRKLRSCIFDIENEIILISLSSFTITFEEIWSVNCDMFDYGVALLTDKEENRWRKGPD